MSFTSTDISLTIVLPEASVAQLMEALAHLVPGFFSVETKVKTPEATFMARSASQETKSSGGVGRSETYACEVIGAVLSAPTLPRIFAKIVDLMDELDPAILEKLSEMKPSYARNYISRDKEKVHIRSPQLETMSTKSGWWISKNIGRAQLIGALCALCNAAGLEYGKDLRLL